MRDWKETLSQVQMAKTGSKKKGVKMVKRSKPSPFRHLLKSYSRTHPRNIIIELSPHFDTIMFNRGSWPDETSQEVSPEFVLNNVGDLTTLFVIKGEEVCLRTNTGYFKFYNKGV